MGQHQGSGGDPGAPALAGPRLLPSLAQSREAPPCDCDVRQDAHKAPPWPPAAEQWPAPGRLDPRSSPLQAGGKPAARPLRPLAGSMLLFILLCLCCLGCLALCHHGGDSWVWPQPGST